MKVCLYDAGAIGGYLAVELARAEGVEVSAIARGTPVLPYDASRRPDPCAR